MTKLDVHERQSTEYWFTNGAGVRLYRSVIRQVPYFDNYTSPMEHLGTFAITGHPVKLDSLLIVICSEGYARLIVGFEEITVLENHFLIVMEGKPFEVLELSKNFKAELMCLKKASSSCREVIY